MLSARMEALELSKYLLLSKGDMVQGVDKNKSAKEDLFEALIGPYGLILIKILKSSEIWSINY